MDITPRNIPNGAEVDITIPEDFPVESLVQFINSFAQVSIVCCRGRDDYKID